MRILFDQGTPVPLRRELTGHEIRTAYEMAWAQLRNGELLREAEAAFDLFVTTDQNLRYQQNLANRRLAILVLPAASWPRLRRHLAETRDAIDDMTPGQFRQLTFPHKDH